MSAASPTTTASTTRHLAALGERLRERRKALRVSSTAAAEAAGRSRVTLHRIERGEPSVTIGAYLGVAEALGLSLDLVTPAQPVGAAASSAPAPLPDRIDPADHTRRS